MFTLNDIVIEDIICNEYKKTFLLSIFKKMCIRMKNDDAYRRKITNLFKQSYDRINTIKGIVLKEFDCELSDDEARQMDEWFLANQRKRTTRKPISLQMKKELCYKQNGLCPACGEQLGDDWSKIHVDHVIPWVLVGDELENNYQDLCETCNECKNSRIDYMFYKMIRLI